MSVKFERESIRETTVGGRVPSLATQASRHELVHSIGERLTGGESTTGYLAVSHP